MTIGYTLRLLMVAEFDRTDPKAIEVLITAIHERAKQLGMSEDGPARLEVEKRINELLDARKQAIADLAAN